MPTHYASVEDALNTLAEAIVELRGRLEAHRHVTQVLGAYLEQLDRRFDSSIVGVLIRDMAPAVEAVLRKDDHTGRVQSKAFMDELEQVARIMGQPAPRPTFTIIDGGRPPDR